MSNPDTLAPRRVAVTPAFWYTLRFFASFERDTFDERVRGYAGNAGSASSFNAAMSHTGRTV